LQRLKASSDAVFAVARYQHNRGRGVEIPPLRLAPSAAVNMKYLDGGDLFILTDDRRLRVEVKHRQRHFSSAEDWPDPHVFVSNVPAVDRNGVVYAYAVVSIDFAHAAVIYGSTKPTWYIVERVPSNTGVAEQVYCCPMEKVEFIKLNEVADG
jgi:hypothetical protein